LIAIDALIFRSHNAVVKYAKRREKLATILFDLAKYLLTAVAAASLFAKEVITWLTTILAFFLAVILLLVAWFLTPSD
jgi:hypothetical protein